MGRFLWAIWPALTLAIALALASPPSRAKAGEFEDFAHAQEAYDAGDFETAVTRFEALVGGAIPRLTQRLLIIESRKYLGASYFFVGRRRQAVEQFEALLAEEEDYQLDRVLFPREVVDLFVEVRERVVEARRRAEEQGQQEEEARRRREAERLLQERARLLRLQELAGRQVVERENSRLVATVPFGAGQFQNGNKPLGWLLLVGEGAALATAITTFVVYASLPNDPNRPPTDPAAVEDLSSTLRVVNWISLATFAAAALGGVFEAHLSFVAVDREERDRELPDDLDLEGEDPPPPEASGGLDLSLGLGGVGARLRF